jgi:hypothetical protein
MGENSPDLVTLYPLERWLEKKRAGKRLLLNYASCDFSDMFILPVKNLFYKKKRKKGNNLVAVPK